MKIWFDISNSPHINLFGRLMRELEGEGHRVIITCRPLANTVDLLRLHGFSFEVVGEHYGANFFRKALGYPIRVLQLWRHLAPLGIDAAVSQSSFHSPVVARLLGVRSIYMNDNEHALGNVPSFVAANAVLVPEFMSAEHLRRQLAALSKVTRYKGVKEGIYLWALQEQIDAAKAVRPVGALPVVYIRPEPWAAQYYKGDRNFLDAVILGIKETCDVRILPRGKVQAEHYANPKFAGIRVVEDALELLDIATDCDLFIGAGGTMTREMAVLGIPTISVYQDQLLDVDRYLLECNAFLHRPDLSSADVIEYLRVCARRPADRVLLDKGRESYNALKELILQQ